MSLYDEKQEAENDSVRGLVAHKDGRPVHSSSWMAYSNLGGDVSVEVIGRDVIVKHNGVVCCQILSAGYVRISTRTHRTSEEKVIYAEPSR